MSELGSIITVELDKTIMLRLTEMISVAKRRKAEKAEQFFSELLLLHNITMKVQTSYLKDILYSTLTLITCHPKKAQALKHMIVMLLISATKDSLNEDEDEEDD